MHCNCYGVSDWRKHPMYANESEGWTVLYPLRLVVVVGQISHIVCRHLYWMTHSGLHATLHRPAYRARDHALPCTCTIM